MSFYSEPIDGYNMIVVFVLDSCYRMYDFGCYFENYGREKGEFLIEIENYLNFLVSLPFFPWHGFGLLTFVGCIIVYMFLSLPVVRNVIL